MTAPKSPIQTTLTITLKAGGVQVAESHNPALWQQVLAAITAGDEAVNGGAGTSPPKPSTLSAAPASPPLPGGEVAAFAKEIGVSPDKVTGSISPSRESPHLHLDVHAWAAWAKNNASKGTTAVSATALAGTLLALWFRRAGLGTVTFDHVTAALRTVDVIGKNPTRSIRNCRWLQLRGDSQIVLNPARLADALEVARAFCAGEKVKFAD